ncbi:MAG: tetratricopeptide repeat protein [Prolixibacteraceae bacterium]|nr:tetratricopeptide repeat protein [Prolixibacteraceae bacterium]
MERKNIYIMKEKGKYFRKITSLSFVSVLLLITLHGRSETLEILKKRFQDIFLTGEIHEWKGIIDSLRSVPLSEEKDDVLLYAEYGIIGYYLGYGEKQSAREQLAIYKEHVEQRLEENPRDATALAFRAAYIGFSIWINPLKALYLGGESQYYVEESLKYNNNEPMPLFELGNTLFFRPRLFGGNKEKAIELYKEVTEIYKNEDPYNWMYYHLRTWLGQVYARMGEKEKAREIYKDILKDVPDYKWVKNELLPDLDSEKKRFSIINLE